MMELFELCGRDPDIRFSPFVWKTKMALAHKGFDPDCHPAIFLEKAGYAESGSKTVPVIRDGDQWVSDSWAIAVYLDERYPDRPLLFEGAQALALTRFANAFADRMVAGGLFPLIAKDVAVLLDEANDAYFRKSREARLGMPLEEAAEGRETRIVDVRASWDPLRITLGQQDFLCGDQPGYADYAVFGPFMWAHVISNLEVLSNDDPLYAWRERLFDAHNGLARKATCAS